MTSTADFDGFIEAAWTDHVADADKVAQRLRASLAWLDEPDRIVPYARLVTHVYGEHLARWDDGIALLQSLRQCAGWRGGPIEEGALARSVAVLDYCAGRPRGMDALSVEDQAMVLATVSSALAEQRDWPRAIAALQDAVARVESRPTAATPSLWRALAIGGNNLAGALQQKSERDALETRGMVMAAEIGLKYWTLAGTWQHEERAEYTLARSLLKAGEPERAIEHGQRCAEICAANDAPAFERFFAYAVLACAYRASGQDAAFAAARTQALAFHAEVPQDEQRWCADDLAELAA
jgi:hypothetical protein